MNIQMCHGNGAKVHFNIIVKLSDHMNWSFAKLTAQLLWCSNKLNRDL